MKRKLLALLALGCALATSPAAWAISHYNFTLDTTAYAGTSGVLAFDLIDGDGVTNNTVTIKGLATDGSFADGSDVSLADVNFFNEELRDITFGSYLSFFVELTENFAGGTPDAFSFFLLDSANLLPLFSTGDPGDTGALFVNAIDGTDGGAPSSYAGQLKVPDTGSTLALFGLPLAALAFVSRQRSRRMAAAA